MDPTFDEIPFEIFVAYILPLISIVEVGALTMVNSIWKSIADDQEVWKILYLRTIRVDILDTSVHIGPKWARAPWRRLVGGTWPHHDVVSPAQTVWCVNSFQFKGTCGRCCLPNDLNDSLKSWREVRSDGIASDEFPFLREFDTGYYRRRQTKEYCDYVRSEWEGYNARRGLSTVSLCQNPDHYEFESLGIPGGCRNYKSFKKITLKKMSTQIKHESKKTEKQMISRKRKYEKAKRIMEIHESEFLNAELSHNRKLSLIDKLSTTVQYL